MNISGIGSYSSSYNSIRINRLFNNQQTQSIQPQQSEPAARPQINPQEQQAVRAKQRLSSGDYAKQYESGKTYDLKGADSDITSLDASGAVADSQKSQIMQQYRMFMGETQAQGANQSAMNTHAVRGVENFAF